MHSLTNSLLSAHPALSSRPILVSLVDVVAGAEPSATDRPERRRQQMRMLRQWQRLEKAVGACLEVGVTDSDVTAQADEPPISYCPVVDPPWDVLYEQEESRGMIATFLETIADLKSRTLPPRSYFSLKPSSPMQAPVKLSEQFEHVVTSSETTNTPLDRFLRGSLRTAEACARLIDATETSDATPAERAVFEEAKAALLAQGFTY